MGPIDDAIESMEQAMRRLRQLRQKLVLPAEAEYGLQEAYEKMAGAFGDRAWSLSLDIYPPSDPNNKPLVRYTACDGTATHKAATLTAAVNAALAAAATKRPGPPHPLAEAASLIEKAVPLPF